MDNWRNPEVPNTDPCHGDDYWRPAAASDAHLYDPIPLDTAARRLALGEILQDCPATNYDNDDYQTAKGNLPYGN